jgi:hypothetical protein
VRGGGATVGRCCVTSAGAGRGGSGIGVGASTGAGAGSGVSCGCVSRGDGACTACCGGGSLDDATSRRSSGRWRNVIMHGRRRLRDRRGRRRRCRLEQQRNTRRARNVGQRHTVRQQQCEREQECRMCQQRQPGRRGRCGGPASLREPTPLGRYQPAVWWRDRARMLRQPGYAVSTRGACCAVVPKRCPSGARRHKAVAIVAEQAAHRSIPSRPQRSDPPP